MIEFAKEQAYIRLAGVMVEAYISRYIELGALKPKVAGRHIKLSFRAKVRVV